MSEPNAATILLVDDDEAKRYLMGTWLRRAGHIVTEAGTGRDGLALELEPTADVLSELSEARGPGQTLVGFAAEHGEGAVERGRAKLERKRLDAVVVNDISRSDIGFDSAQNEVTIVTADGERAVERGPKSAVAAAIFDQVEALRARGTVKTSDER